MASKGTGPEKKGPPKKGASKKRRKKLGNTYLQRLSPRLRMICNGDDEVNGFRSALSAAVCDLEGRRPPNLARRFERGATAGRDEEKVIYKLDDLEEGVKVSCFIQVNRPGAVPVGLAESDSPARGEFRTALLTPQEIRNIASKDLNPRRKEAPTILYVETGLPLAAPRATPKPGAAAPPEPRSKGLEDRDLEGEPRVLIGLIDVGGFDFSHPDFRGKPGTRFECIWDQGAEKEGEVPSGYGYGRVITKAKMDRALEAAPQIKVDPTDIVRQSVQTRGSHGTHVASIAAGNKGLCPHAAIAGVLISLSDDEQLRRRTLYDSARLAHAVDFLFDKGEEMGLPTVVNISLGTNGHAHDGSSPVSRWIDAALDQPGRCVCVAAGNSGQEAPTSRGDLGFLMGRIHAAGQVPARGLTADLEWHVVGNSIIDISENELEIWYGSGDEFSVKVRAPNGQWTDAVGPGEYVENLPLEFEAPGADAGSEAGESSQTFLSIYNERYLPSNGDNRISIFLSPRLKEPVKGIAAGCWLVRLIGEEVRDGRFDAWIERDDPRPLGGSVEGQFWEFPSYFSPRSMVDRSSVTSLACGHKVIAVGNADAAAERINPSSSQGPTRDGRLKPDIVAAGTAVVAAKGFSRGADEGEWVAMTGSSMASPWVAGVAGQMLARERRLTARQIQGMLRRTARPLPGSVYDWQDDAGFGHVDAEAALKEVKKPFTPKDLTPAQTKRLGLTPRPVAP